MHGMKMMTAAVVLLVMTATEKAQGVVYEGASGAGQGKHIVFRACYQEYRS